MNAQTTRALPSQRPNGTGSLVAVGNTSVDFRGAPHGAGTGAKKPTRFDVCGGGPFNGAAFGPANGIPTAAIGAQADGWAADLCEEWAGQVGFVPMIARHDGRPALSFMVPDDQPGHKDVFTQRTDQPIQIPELPEHVLRTARALIVGPIPCEGDGQATCDLLNHLCGTASKAYRALIPHPSLLGHPDFSQIARRFHLVQINKQESCLLPGATADIDLNVLRLRFLADGADVAVTNGSERGWLWADGDWYGIDPQPIVAIDDVGAGDAFCAALVIARVFCGATARQALDYAVKSAASWVTQSPPRAIVPF